MNWLPKPSLYHEQAAKSARQRASHQSFLSGQSSLSASISDITIANTQETTNLVSKVALQRMGYNKKA